MFPFNLEMQSFQKKKLIALENNFQTAYDFFIFIKGDLTLQIVIKNVKC
jgi:hypothetical protein